MPRNARQKLQTARLVVLREGYDDLTFAEVRAELTPAALKNDMADERKFLAALQEAVTNWVRTTAEGRQWYEDDTSEDANIGDLCAHGIPDFVAKALAKQGIVELTIECTCVNDSYVCRNWVYDTLLVDEDALKQTPPEAETT